MDETQTECFRLYSTIPKRSIPKLHKLTQDLNMGITIRQLHRWSQQYHWTKLAKESAASVAAAIQEEMQPILIDHAKQTIEILHKIQDRFLQRLALDPANPMLTQAERERAIDPDFKEFAEAVKLERLIIGDPTERREDVQTSRVLVEFTNGELFQAAQQIAEKRYGLPPPKVVTHESE
jgi:hypothetical protein